MKLESTNIFFSQNFLSWLRTFCLTTLHPSAAFGRRTSALAALQLMAATFKSEEQDGYSTFKGMTQSEITALVDCLADSFEENKRQALGLLEGYMQSCGPVWKVG